MNKSTLASLKQNLPEPEGLETSYALVLVDGILGPEHFSALVEAKRICDVVVFASLIPVAPVAEQALKATEVDVFLPLYEENTETEIALEYRGKNIIKILQAILALLPSAVIVPESDLPLWHKMQSLLKIFPDLFVLHRAEVLPMHLPQKMQKIRQNVAEISQKNTQQFLEDVFSCLQTNQLKSVEEVTWLNAQTLEKLSEMPLNKKFCVFYQGQLDGRVVRDTIRITPSLFKKFV